MINEIEKLLQKYQEQLVEAEKTKKTTTSVWVKLDAVHRIPILRQIVSDLIILEANTVSATSESSREYLESEGIDVDKVVKEGMDRINKLKEKINPST